MPFFQLDGFMAASLGFALGLIAFEALRRHVIDKHYADIVITIISIGFIALIDAASLLAMTCLAAAVFTVTRLKLFEASKLGLVAFFIVASLIALKSLSSASPDNPLLLVGLSYYYFRLGSFVIEAGRGNKVYTEASLRAFATWVFFFPLFLAGPIQRFHQLERQPVQDEHLPAIYLKIGFWLVVKIVIADALIMAMVLTPIRGDLIATMAAATPLTGALIFAAHGVLSLVHGYLDLLAYTQIAIGGGALFGYTVMPNFNRPLLATNITEFWRRWHISLSSWARDYVYFPLYLKTRIPAFATYATMLTIGLWHAFNLNWVIWALAHGTAIVAHGRLKQTALLRSLAADQRTTYLLTVVSWATTILFVGCVYNLVAFPGNYERSWQLLAALSGFG